MVQMGPGAHRAEVRGRDSGRSSFAKALMALKAGCCMKKLEISTLSVSWIYDFESQQ